MLKGMILMQFRLECVCLSLRRRIGVQQFDGDG
jgi:hypothetical protein